MKLNNIWNKIRRNRHSSKLADKEKTKNVSQKYILGKLPIKKIIYIFIFLFFVLVIYNYLPFIIGLLNDNLKKADGDNGILNSINDNRVNILLIGLDNKEEYSFVDALSLMVVDYQTDEMGIFSISPDIQINIPRVNKRTEIRKILNNRELRGVEMDGFIEALESFLGLKIDRYITIDINGFDRILSQYSYISIELSNGVNDINTKGLPLGKTLNYSSGIHNIDSRELLSIIASDENGLNDKMNRQNSSLLAIFKSLNHIENLININNIWKEVVANVRTNMSKVELFNLVYRIAYLRDDQIKKGYIKSSSLYTVPTTNAYKSYRVFSERLDKDIAQIFFNVNVFKEQARVEIFNGSGVRSLAANRTRWLRNIGINVVKVDNAIEMLDETTVYINNPEKYPATIQEINKLFPKGYKALEGQYYSRQVGDIVIIIGRNY